MGEPGAPARRYDLAGLFVLAAAVRLALLVLHPGIHGGDSVARLAHADRLVLAYQLPLPQAVVVAARWLWPDPRLVQVLFILIGAAVATGLAAVVSRIESPLAGRAAGLLAGLHPLFIYYSLVPYQEGPMLALLAGGAAALLAGKERTAALLIGLACLCRYEAWPAAALAFAGRCAARRRISVREVVLWGWAPLLWMAWSRGLSPGGTYVLDLDASAGRIRRLPVLLGKVREYSGDVLLALALAGAVVLLWRRGDRRWWWGTAWIGLLLALVAAAGHETPPGSGLVSERIAHAPALALCALAGAALGRLSRGTVRSALAAVLIAGLGLSWVRRTDAHLRVSHADPSLRLAMEVAAAAHARLPPEGRLLVIAPPVSPEALDDYIGKVARAGGDRAKAETVARDLARWSPDADRVAAHLPRRVGTVVSPPAEGADLVAVFDDASEGIPGDVVAELRHGERRARLLAPR